MKLAPVLLVLVAHAIICGAQSVNNPCELSPDLFERRAVLVNQGAAPEHPTKPGAMTGDEQRAQIRAFNEQYYQFMMALSDDASQHRLAELKTCCAQNTHDPIALLTCRLALYLTNQITAKEFVEQFPVSGDLNVFLALDAIAYVKDRPNSLPPLFGVGGPVDSYTTELLKLATKGDKQALQKYLQLYLRAGGVLADGMADQVKRLFLEHPEFVLNNWYTLKKNMYVIPNLQDSLSDDEKRQMRQNYAQYCHVNEGACREVIRALK